MAELPGACDISSRLLPTLYFSPSHCRNGTCYDSFGGVNQDGRGMESQAIDWMGLLDRRVCGSTGGGIEGMRKSVRRADECPYIRPGWLKGKKGADGLAEETQQGFLLVFVVCQARDLAGHFA